MNLRRMLTVAMLVTVAVPGTVWAIEAMEEEASPCAEDIIGVQTGATGELMGSVSVTTTISHKFLGFGTETTETHLVGTYMMSNGYTYKVNCTNGRVLSAS